MKIKILAIFGLAVMLGFGACKSSTNTNANMNSNTMTMATPTPVMKTNETATVDPNLKMNIERELKAKGFSDVTVDTSTTPMTLRGTVAKGKLQDLQSAVTAANGGKPVKNEVTEK